MNTQDFYALATISKLCFEFGVGMDMVVEINCYYMSLNLFGYSLYFNWNPNEAPLHICHIDAETFHKDADALLDESLTVLCDEDIINDWKWDSVNASDHLDVNFVKVDIPDSYISEPNWYSVKALDLLNLLMNNQLTSSVYPFNNCMDKFSFILTKEFKT